MSIDIEAIQTAFLKNPDFKPYLSSIVFPNYKNIFPGEELTFEFPLTLLIGKNGTNKSSLLHALYGCPDRKSTGEYWFATHMDPIMEDGGRPNYFYRYIIPETGHIAEVQKKRIEKKTKIRNTKYKDPDYWEPTRPTVGDGMASIIELDDNNKKWPAGRSKTRWEAIKKEVVYLDFRAEISAFDKAFYKEDPKTNRLKHKNNLRSKSKALKNAILRKLDVMNYYNKNRIFKNSVFSDGLRSEVNKILDKDYTEIVYIEHDFYMSKSFSVHFKKGEKYNFSEAFAGSGETSIVRLVYALQNAPDRALVLLDEPETSLHIEAQDRLQKFLLEQIQQKKLQIVMSTHSPFFAEGLPDCAIKVMQIDENSQKVKIQNSAPANQSSFYLGRLRNNARKINIYVEDPLAEAIVRHVWKTHLREAEKDIISVHSYSGGDTGLLSLAVSEMSKDNSNVCFLFDGDCIPKCGFIPDPQTIPEADNEKLDEILKITFGRGIRIQPDSSNPDERVAKRKKFLSFARDRFKYLPFHCPEEFIVQNHSDFENLTNTDNPKEIIREYAKKILGSTGEVRASEILVIQRKLISEIANNNDAYQTIKNVLLECSEFAP